MSKKIHLPEIINLAKEENNSLLTNCEEVTKELNNFFANAVKNLNSPNYEYCDSLAENIDDPSLKAIFKWRNYSRILAIASEYANRANFSFNFDVLSEIKTLNYRPVSILKIFERLLGRQLLEFFGNVLSKFQYGILNKGQMD